MAGMTTSVRTVEVIIPPTIGAAMRFMTSAPVAMTSKQLGQWFSVVSLILILWGVLFAVFGLRILPVDRTVLRAWGTIYGAIMIGWGVTLFLLGRVALRRRDPELTRPLLTGIAVWLLIEAVFSARYGVWFNVGVDVAVLVLFSVPLIAGALMPYGNKTRTHG